jgi:hypothetical protein
MKISLSKVPERITVKVNKTEGILNWDIDNCYPQRIMLMVKSSGRAINCTECYAKFIEGDGFKDLVFYTAKVNEDGLTMDKLLRSLVDDYSYFKGFAIHVNYDANYKIVEYNYLPFEHTRLGVPDDENYVGKIAVYQDWGRWLGKRIKNEDIKFIDVFNPDPKIIQYQVDAAGGWEFYKGQIYWYSAAGPHTYPEATLDSVIEDVDTDSQIKIFKQRNARVGFTDPTLFIHKGVFATQRERDEQIARLRQFQGAENEGQIMLVETSSDEAVPEIKSLTTQNKDRKYENTETTVQDNIRRAIGAPKILVSDDVPGSFGSPDQFNNAALFYSSMTNKERRIFEETFQMLHAYYHNPGINPSNNFSIIPIRSLINVTPTP